MRCPRVLVAVLASFVALAVLAGVSTGVATAATDPTPSTSTTSSTPSATVDAEFASRLATSKGPGYDLKGGKYHKIGLFHLGALRYLGHLVYCNTYGAKFPDGPAAVGTGRLPQMPDRESSARASLIVDWWGDTASKQQSAATELSLHRLTRNPKFAADEGYYLAQLKKIDPQVDGLSKKMLSLSRTHGPYRVVVSVTQGTQVGQRIAGTVTVLGSNGKPASGRAVKVAVSGNARLTGANGSTNTHGQARFDAVRTNYGTVAAQVTVTSPSSSQVWINRPSRGHQTVLWAGHTERATGRAVGSYRAPKAPTITKACSTNCDGTAAVTVSALNPAGVSPVRWTFTVGRAKVATLDVPAGRSAARSFKARDADKVVSTFCYTSGGKCFTKPVTLREAYEVVCPAWVEATPEKPCKCKGPRTVTYKYHLIAASTRHYEVNLQVDGKVQTQALDRAGTAKLSSPLKAEDTVTVSFVAYRSATDRRPLLTGEIDNFTQH